MMRQFRVISAALDTTQEVGDLLSDHKPFAQLN